MKIEKEILAIIDSGYIEGSLYYLPSIQLDRQTYLKVNKILELLGGKWNRKEKAHVFKSDISDAIDNVLLTGEVIDMKKEFQFFETPPKIVQQMIELANIQSHHRCLEPSAGQGAIAEEVRKIIGERNITCVELMKENIEDLYSKNLHVVEGNFLDMISFNDSPFDRIIMNPPFSKQQDIQHVSHALEFLISNGILVSVMSPGILFRQNKRTKIFLDTLEHCFHSYEIIELPEGSFKISGTAVNTILLKIVK